MPAYNNANVIGETLVSLATQAIPEACSVRVLISDDGSTDDTPAIASQALTTAQLSGEVVIGEHGGPGAARNQALEHANGDILLLLGADILLQPGALAAHFEWHQQHPEQSDAALGWVAWDPVLQPTPLMEWLVHGGPQNDFDALLGSPTADPRHFFNGSHVSLKRTLLGEERFSSEFSEYGWEDLDLGRRLATRGMRLHMLEGARALHHHAYSGSAATARQQAAGRGLHGYQKLHPGEQLMPIRGSLHKALYLVTAASGMLAVLRLVRSWCASRVSTPRLFSLVATLDLWSGIYSREKSN